MALTSLQSGNVTTSASSLAFAGGFLTPLSGGRALLLWNEYSGPLPGTSGVTTTQVRNGWVTRATVAAFTGSGYSFTGSPGVMAYIGPTTRRSATATSDGNVLVMTGPGGSTGARGYRLLEIDPDTDAVTVHDQVDVTGESDTDAARATWTAQATGRLPGTDTFIQLRQTWQHIYAEAVRVSGTTVTVVATAALLPYDFTNGTGTANSQQGTVIPLDAGTALVALAVPGFVPSSGGGGAFDYTLDVLRLFKVALSGSSLTVTHQDISWPFLAGTSTGLYRTDGAYVAEIIGGNPSTTTSANAGTINGPLIRRGIAYAGGTFTVTDLPLDQLDPAVVPAGLTGTTFLPAGFFIPITVEDQLVVAHAANVTSSGVTSGYTMITAYDRATGGITDTYWDQAAHATPKELDGYYDPTTGDLVLTVTDVSKSVLNLTIFTSPGFESASAGDVRVIDYTLNPSYPISQQLRSTSSAFI